MQIPVEVFLGGLASILGAVVGAGIRRVWVWGYQLQDMTVDRNFWRDVALAGMKTASKAVEVVEKSGG